MKRHTPGSTPALIKALGPDPLLVQIGGQTWPADLSSGFTMRRARPSRDPVGEPASCSVTVVVESPPSWQKGDPFSVELADTALDRLFGTQSLTYTNYVPNPGLNYGTSAGWVNLAAATLAVVDETTEARPDTGSKALKVTCTADLDGARTAPTAETPGAEVIGPDTPLRAVVWVKLDAGETLRVALEHGYSAFGDASVVQTVDELTLIGDGSWREVTLGGYTNAVRNYTPLLRFQSKSGAQVFYVDAALITVAEFDVAVPSAQVPYFDGSSANGSASALGQFFGYNVTHSWAGTVNNSWSTRFVDKLPAIEQARRRFVGKLSDLRMKSKRGGWSQVELIGVGTLAQLGGISVGDEPWPAESVATRAGRILSLAQAKGGPVYTVGSTSGANVQNKDVDRKGASELLSDLARSAGATHGLIERRDGTLTFAAGFADDAPAVAVPASLVPAELEHEQAELINDVTVLYGPSDGPTAGVVLHTNLVTNPSFEVDALLWSRGSAALRLYQETTLASVGTKCARVETTAAGGNPYIYSDPAPATPGRYYYGRARVRPGEVGVDSRVLLRFYDSTGALLLTPAGAAVRSTAVGWYTCEVKAVAPANTATVRLLVQSYMTSASVPLNTMDVGDKWWVDACLLREVRGDETPDPADYFDGSTAAAGGYTYGWNGTAHASTSERRASGSSTPRLSVRAIDAASVAAHGRAAITLDTELDQYSDANGTVYDRGIEEWSPSGWQLPPLSFDLLQLLDGRAAQAFAPTSQGAETPRQLAEQLARVELGSYLTIDDPGYYPGPPFDVSHLPASSIDAPGRVTTLNETISARRWSIATEQERTT